MDKKNPRVLPVPGRPGKGIGEDGHSYELGVEDGKKLFRELDKKKGVDPGIRAKGMTKRTIDRYKKVFRQFTVLQKKYTAKKKSELYELCSIKEYDGKSYSRNTIRNIIEDKKYNLKPT